MKAIRFTKYGPPNVLQLVEVEKPVPGEDQVLVKVRAAAANPLDWHYMRGAPFLLRMVDGLLKPKDPRLGADLAGQVEAVGSRVNKFQPGDEVFGASRGSFAEYVLAGESRVAHKPASVSFEAAAASPITGLTALQGLRDHGQIRAGQSVLINGASGGVGTFAVQMARHFGAAVTGVCSTPNLDLVRSIGADHAIDYTQQDFTRTDQQYDLIFDAVGNRSVNDLVRALSPQGRCVIAGYGGVWRLLEVMILGSRLSKPAGKQVGGMGLAQVNHKDLATIGELLAAGMVMPVIERRYPLSETAEAIRHLETRHARGKVVIMVQQPVHGT